MINIELEKAIQGELNRQEENIELIASENFVSKDILKVTGTILTNKYAEGYPNKRYYGGCKYIDEVEELAKNLLKELYQAEHVNVQPHSGSSANMAAYMSVLKPNDRILGMDLKAGGHLTHGYVLSFSGQLFEAKTYGLNAETEELDYDEILKIAKEFKPKMIVAGASAYSKVIDFKKFREIADEVGAYLMVDMAHIAGLVAAKIHPSPIPYADIVTSTTHKTLRGPRGGIVLCKQEFAKQVDRAVFPGIQGGPLMHIIAAKAQCFHEALQPEFIEYQKQVVKNCKTLANELEKSGLRIVSGGTENHLVLIDLTNFNITGKEAEEVLDEVNITCNKNAIPNDPLKPMITSGIRLGTAAMTTKGFKEEEFKKIANYIVQVLKNPKDVDLKTRIKKEIIELNSKFKMY